MNKHPQITDATRKAIMEGFWELYTQKRIDKITVQEITKRANVHRSTFYRYFTDVYDLLNQLEEELLNNITESLHGKTEFLEMVAATSLFAEKLYYLTGATGDPEFRKKLTDRIRPIFLSVHHISENAPRLDYLFSFVWSIMLTNLHYWYEHQDDFTLQDVASMSLEIIGNGLCKFAQ